MNTVLHDKPDLRDCLAEERTFLAWMRTGIALMGFGFLIAHFGTFGDEVAHAAAVMQRVLSLWLGLALVLTGIAVNLLAARRYIRVTTKLNGGQLVHRPGVALALAVALFGVALTICIMPDLI
jgi:putative membrane protein